MALAERTWERVGERKRDRARLIESAESGTGWIRIDLWIYSIRLLLDTCKD